MKVLLLHTPIEYELVQEYTGDSLGLGYVAAVLRQDGHEVEILDALVRNLKPQEAIREVLAREFDCLGITANHYHKNVLISTVRQVRQEKRNGFIIVGGYLPTLSTADLLTTCREIDIAVLGEGESVISDLLGRLDHRGDWRSTPGIAYVREGMVVANPIPQPIKDLDTLPFPSRDGILQAPRNRPVKLVRVISSRGCYHRCSFCCIPSFYALSGSLAPRMRRAEKIVDEIEATMAETGMKSFRFSDDDFIGPSPKTREHVARLVEELSKRKLPITFDIECRADDVTEDILTQLKDVGMTGVYLGIESGVQSQLDRYNKHTTVEQNRRAIEMIRNLGLKLSTGFIAFEPYVTIGELAENIQFLNETGIADEVGRSSPGTVIHKALTRLAVFPGVPLITQMKADGLLIDNGMEIEYRFKDRWVRMLNRTLLVLEFLARLVGRLRTARQK